MSPPRVVGGFAINRLGFVRATEAIHLRIARYLANQIRIKRTLEILPDRALRELGDEDIARWVIDRGGLAAPFDREPSAVGPTTGSLDCWPSRECA